MASVTATTTDTSLDWGRAEAIIADWLGRPEFAAPPKMPGFSTERLAAIATGSPSIFSGGVKVGRAIASPGIRWRSCKSIDPVRSVDGHDRNAVCKCD